MSRIGKNPIAVPGGVDVTIAGSNVRVKGPKGELSIDVVGELTIEVDKDGARKVTGFIVRSLRTDPERPADIGDHTCRIGCQPGGVHNDVGRLAGGGCGLDVRSVRCCHRVTSLRCSAPEHPLTPVSDRR